MIVSKIASLAVYLFIHLPRLPHLVVLHPRRTFLVFLPILGLFLIWKPREMRRVSQSDPHLKHVFRVSPWWLAAVGWFVLLLPLWLVPGEYF